MRSEGLVVEKIRRLREEQSLSQQELADRAGVAKSTVYEAETARRTPKLESLEKIATALGISVAELLEGR
jgi:transcriptional regulator with XRE-family HTH domain